MPRAARGTASPPRLATDRATSTRLARTHVARDLVLDCGATLPRVVQAYHLDGELNTARDNAVLVFHALTGSADAAGDWWRGLIGPGCAIDTERHAVICANLLGSCYGTTGPASDDAPSPFPRITPRDMARAVARIADELDIASFALVAGGSLGGMVAMEFALLHPARARSLAVFAAPAAHTAWAIAWNAIQRRALELGASVDEALGLARMVGMMTYRTEREFGARFGRERGDAEQFSVERYLRYHGEKLAARFDPASYRTLTDAMDAHDIGAGRGGERAALRALRAAVDGPVVAVGVPGDNLYSADEVRRWAAAAGALYRELHSTRGHDAFLLELDQVGAILRDTLAIVAARDAARARLAELELAS